MPLNRSYMAPLLDRFKLTLNYLLLLSFIFIQPQCTLHFSGPIRLVGLSGEGEGGGRVVGGWEVGSRGRRSITPSSSFCLILNEALKACSCNCKACALRHTSVTSPTMLFSSSCRHMLCDDMTFREYIYLSLCIYIYIYIYTYIHT